MAIMGLEVLEGHKVQVIAGGPDAEQAARELAEALREGLGEGGVGPARGGGGVSAACRRRRSRRLCVGRARGIPLRRRRDRPRGPVTPTSCSVWRPRPASAAGGGRGGSHRARESRESAP